MNRSVCSGLLILLLSAAAAGQTKYSFKVAVDRYNPVKVSMPLTLEVNGARVSTNGDGIFSLPLDASLRYIKVNSTDNNKYRILYPPDGTVFIPVNNNDIPDIVIGLPDRDQTTQEAIRVLRQLDSIRNDLRRERAGNIDRVLLAKQDSILKIAGSRYSITDADLRTAREIMEGRDKYFRQISFSLKSYLNEAKDLRDAFSNLASYALNNPKAFKLLDSTIHLYSRSYDSINSNNMEWEEDVRRFWFSNELALQFRNVVDFALNDLHREYFLMLNDDVIKNINAFFNESNSRRRNSLKETVSAAIGLAVPHLNNRIDILDTKVNAFLGVMQSMNNDYHTH